MQIEEKVSPLYRWRPCRLLQSQKPV